MKTFPLGFTIFSAAQLLFLCNSIVAGTESMCDSEAVELCTKLHKQGCEELGMEKRKVIHQWKQTHDSHLLIWGPSECGNCLDGYGKVSSICVGNNMSMPILRSSAARLVASAWIDFLAYVMWSEDTSQCEGSQTPSKVLLPAAAILIAILDLILTFWVIAHRWCSSSTAQRRWDERTLSK